MNTFSNIKELVSALNREHKLLSEMGERGRIWVEGHASAGSVAQRYEALYTG